tara:strand:- start:1319 stop:1660 length:342 start_codon:yes stop_codon:yes gene_type:complete
MCLGGGVARMTPPQREYQNRPVTVTGEQTGVDDPKDTKKATESLKIKRKKEEGTYVDPNLTTADKLTRRSGNKRVIRRVDGKLTSMSRNKYRSTLRSRARNSRMSGSRSNKKR